MNPRTKTSGVSAKNTKAEILAAYQELKQQLAEPKKVTTKTPMAPTQVLENEIGQLVAV